MIESIGGKPVVWPARLGCDPSHEAEGAADALIDRGVLLAWHKKRSGAQNEAARRFENR